MGTAPQGRFTLPPARERSYAATARQRAILTNNVRTVLQGTTAPAVIVEPTMKSRAPPASFPTSPGPIRRRPAREPPALLGTFAWEEPLRVPGQNEDVSNPWNVALVISRRAEGSA